MVDSWSVQEDLPQPESSIKAIDWFRARFNQELEVINSLFDKFKISEALMATYKLIWDDFCSWYLEMIKPGYQHPIDRKTLETTKSFFEDILKLAHPFTPFIAEEIWQQLKPRNNTYIVNAQWPENDSLDSLILDDFQNFQEIVIGLRNLRKQNNISNKVFYHFFNFINIVINKF